MHAGATIPVDYCVSTIARVCQQTHAPAAALDAVIEQLVAVSPTQFRYPASALHMSLIGFTQRYHDKTTFTPARLARLQRLASQHLQTVPPLHFMLKGVGILNSQIFVQVFPHTPQWQHLREALDVEIHALGETPVTYANKAPIHLNIMRITDNAPEQIAALLAEIRQLRDYDFGVMTVDAIEFVITDFVGSVGRLEILKHF